MAMQQDKNDDPPPPYEDHKFVHSSSNDSHYTRNPWLRFRRAKIVTVEPVLFLYSFSSFLIYYLNQEYYFNQYALEKISSTERELLRENGSSCINLTNLDDYTHLNNTYKIVESQSNSLSLYCTVVNRVLAIAVTLILGPLSDRYGRRIVIIIVSIGQILKGAVSLCVINLNLNLYLFILGSGLCGLSGDASALYTACFSYVSDFSSKKWRTVRIAIVESMIFFSGMISTGAGGFWFDKLNCQLKYPVILFVICNVAAIVYTIVLLPESLPTVERKAKAARKPKGISSLVSGFRIIFCQVPKYLASVCTIWVALGSMFIMVVVMSSSSIGVYFFKALNWSPTLIGIYLSVSMGSHLLVLLFVLPALTALKFPDALLSCIALLFNIFMTLFLGLSHKVYQVFIVAVVQGMDAMMVPPMRGLMSKLVAVEDQGALFSIVASVESLASLLAGIAFPIILPITLEHNLNPGTSYMIMSAVGVIGLPFLIVLLVWWCIGKIKERSGLQQQDDPKAPLLGSATDIQNS